MPEPPERPLWLSLPLRGARALRGGLGFLFPETGPLEMRLLGRMLLHAALVGGLAGVLGAAFFFFLEAGQWLLLEGLAGYSAVRAKGEIFLRGAEVRALRPWLLALLPALGGLASGLLCWKLAPETSGGGGDAVIDAYHQDGGVVRRRVVGVKMAASLLTLAAGGSGGREGPTMQIGGAIGSLVARYLPTTSRERRILLVAGVAAGIAAVFRTPLGAALLAVEMLYRDDFESDALIPAILASVVSYAVVISIFGETTLFGQPPRFSFVPSHLPLYGVLALGVSLFAALFVVAMRSVKEASAGTRVPAWARPAVGGLAMGLFGTALVLWFGVAGGPSWQGMGVFGGGYGLAQVALTGSAALPPGWRLVVVLLALAGAKLVASALTIGSGGSAGDFAPSLVMGGLLGGAFGHAVALLWSDPRIEPAAFALVGMGTFYGGVAHTPLSAVVLVSELAGSYDLLVPMMLATGIAFVVLRRWTLYPSQPRTKRQSPVHRGPDTRALSELRAREVLVAPETAPLEEATPIAEVVRRASEASRQLVFPVLGPDGAPKGLVDWDPLRLAAPERDLGWAVAADLMVPFTAVGPETTLRVLGEVLLATGLSQVAVADGGRILGFVGEAEIARAYLAAETRSAADRDRTDHGLG